MLDPPVIDPIRQLRRQPIQFGDAGQIAPPGIEVPEVLGLDPGLALTRRDPVGNQAIGFIESLLDGGWDLVPNFLWDIPSNLIHSARLFVVIHQLLSNTIQRLRQIPDLPGVARLGL